MVHKYIFHLFHGSEIKYYAVVIASNSEEAKQLAHLISGTDVWVNSKYMIITTCRTTLTSRVLALEKSI